MPATVTHAFFILDVYNKIDKKNLKEAENYKNNLKMFAQSTDSLMFYNILNLKKGKNIRKYQSITHYTKTNEFFTNLITHIKENKYYEDPQILSFLYGFISHFCLDSNIHPYIIYKTGYFNKKDKESIKYNGLHHYIETFFDNYLIKEKLNMNPKNFDISNFCFTSIKFSNNLKDTIDFTFKKTYGLNNMSKIYYISLKQMKSILSIFRKDKYGIKKKSYKVMDKLTPKNTFVLDSLSYNQDLNKYKKYLNDENKIWNYPIDKNIISTMSFKELYNYSLEECIYIINNINEYFFNNKEININKLFKNRSYVTGIDCENKSPQKYFEF